MIDDDLYVGPLAVTEAITAAVATGCIVNLKKGQFLSPAEMGQVVEKARSAGGRRLLITERGTTFGYHNLVADMRAIPQLRRFGCPVVFDATHSVQLPGAGGTASSGQREFAPVLAGAALAAGGMTAPAFGVEGGRDWTSGIYRQLHIDAHLSACEKPYETFNAEAAAQMFLEAGFQMVCYFSLPPAVKILDLKNDLNRIGDESNIDIRFDAVISK